MYFLKNRNIVIALTGVFLILGGCGGGSGSGPVDAMGRISLGISDGPIHDAKKVCITFDEIEFMSQGTSTVVTVNLANPVNLLEFQGMNAFPLLTNEELTAGQYQWMRIGVDAEMGSTGGAGDMLGDSCDGSGSYIVMSDDTIHSLFVPSGFETGLKLVGGFTVPVNGTADFTAEFDLMKSITAPMGPSGDVVLRPTIRLVNNVEAGTLTGQVDNDLATANSCAPSVYVFDDGVMPNAIDGTDDPVATAMVNTETDATGQTEYRYTVGFLLAGDYEVAFTCNGVDFEPMAGKPAAITEKTVTTVNFLPE